MVIKITTIRAASAAVAPVPSAARSVLLFAASVFPVLATGAARRRVVATR